MARRHSTFHFCSVELELYYKLNIALSVHRGAIDTGPDNISVDYMISCKATSLIDTYNRMSCYCGS